MTLGTGDLRRGASLVELSVALAMLALATAIVWPRWTLLNERGREDTAHRWAVEERRRAMLADERAVDAG